MTEFEYLAVFVSIVFGISVAHILSGTIRAIYRSTLDDLRLVLTIFFFLVLVLNWWTGFEWRDQGIWSLDRFFAIIVWAVTHYVAAITLYPPQATGSESPFKYHPQWFMWAFVSICATDILQTWARGDVFSEPLYLPFVLHMLVLSFLAAFLNKRTLYRAVGWYLLVIIVAWAMGIRRFLV